MELGTGIGGLNITNTTAYLAPTEHVKSWSLKSWNFYSKSASSYISFRTHRSPIWKACVKENSTSKSVSKVHMMSADDYSSEVNLKLSDLTALCPVDGRYWARVKELVPFLTQFGLIKFQVLIQIRWLQKLSETFEVSGVPSFSEEAESYLHNLIDQFNIDDALEVKKIEKDHGMKAVECFLKQRCQSHPEILKVLEFFHTACTIEDINNLAHALMLKEALDKVILPVMDKLISAIICIMAAANASKNQASLATIGKEMEEFALKLGRERDELSQIEILGNFSVSVKNDNADVNWPQIAEEFVTSLGISFDPSAAQIEPHRYKARLLDCIIQFNDILIKFDGDIWRYISSGHFEQITKAGEIGSSTMPHKVNPIDFENSEGNCGIANGGVSPLSKTLRIFRREGDLTDSVWSNVSVGLAHSLLACNMTLQGIAKLQVNGTSLIADMEQLWKENTKSAADCSLDFEFSSLTAFCPLECLYWAEVNELAPFMSEFGLIKFRVLVEITWLLKLSQNSEVSEVPSFSKEAESYLRNLSDQFNMDDAMEVKEIEKVTNHDVKAVEYFLKQRCQSHSEISKVLEFFHFACTSEDINNLAYASMLKEALDKVIFPVMDRLISAISNMAVENASIPMLSRTHGQPASPTTLGKEMAIFANRLSQDRKILSQIEIFGKFAGAVGNYSAHLAAYPDVNWPQIAEEFVTSFGIRFNAYVTQIEPHDYMARLFDQIKHFNNILVDFDKDVLGYISLGYFKQGSSTMTDQVNFENSKSNCETANGNLSHLSTKLPISRFQRDLTDSTALRNIGVGLGHSLIAYKNALQGIDMLQVNEASLIADLDKSWEVLAEPIQTVMRRYNVPEPYEKLKALTRGRAVTKESIREFIESLDIPIEPKNTLLNLTPHTYVGAAVELAKNLDNKNESCR